MGLGSFPATSLADARGKAAAARKLREQGLDPIEEREAEKRQAAVATAKTITFERAADTYIGSHEAGWRNPKHRQQWTNTIRTYANPVIGELGVRDIDSGLVMRVLGPIACGSMRPPRIAGYRAVQPIADHHALSRRTADQESPCFADGHVP